MKDMWKPNTAGVLNIVSGMYGILWGLIIVTAFRNIWSTMFFIFGLVALIGGIYAIKHIRWQLALAASISTILCAPVITIPSGVLIIQSKKDFVDNKSSLNQTELVGDGSVLSYYTEKPGKNLRRIVIYVAIMIAAISLLFFGTLFTMVDKVMSLNGNAVLFEGMARMSVPAMVIVFGAVHYTKNVLHSITKYSVVLFIVLGLVAVSFPFILALFDMLFWNSF